MTIGQLISSTLSSGNFSNYLKAVLAALAIASVMIALFRSCALLHRDFFQNRRVKRIDNALKMLTLGSTEERLLSELKRQELFAQITKLRYARSDREQILSWVDTGAVSLDLISRARLHIHRDKVTGRRRVRIPWYEPAFAFYFLICTIVMWLFASLPFFLSKSSSVNFFYGKFGWLLVLGGFTAGLMMFLQAKSVYYARVLQQALIRGGIEDS